MSKYLLLIAFFLTSVTLKSQIDKIGYGFRAGMSIAKIDGTSELGPNGEELEENKMASGFHIGMSFNFKFTDIMGLRTELTYSRRGNDYLYDGPSYFMLPSTTQPVTIMGNRRQKVNLSNSYVDVPLLLYYKLGNFEISGGLNTGLLVSSTAIGNIEFDRISPLGAPQESFAVNVDYNYKKDDAGSASSETKIVEVDGIDYTLPVFLGAYYDFPVKDKN